MNKILLIDDEEAIVRLLAMSLRADGYEVVTAMNGEEGVAVFKEASPEVVLTDIKMPGMDGIEVLKTVKTLNPDIEVIIITGHGDIDSAIEALKYGASDFINKPIREAALSIALRRAEEKLDIRHKLKEYTVNLEQKVEAATGELRRKSGFLAQLIRSSNDGIVATDQDYTVVVFNPGSERIFGLSKEDVVGKINAFDLFPTDVKETLASLSPDNGPNQDLPWKETTLTAMDGTVIPVRYSCTLLFDGNVLSGSVAFFQDLTEVKRLEKELVKNERLAAIGQTVAGLAHGIKNILHGLKGGSYLVDIGIKRNDTTKLKNGWDMIKRNIGRTSDLVMNLLSYAKEREPELKPCRPAEIVADVCGLIKEEADAHRVSVISNVDPHIGTVVVDPETVHQSLLNLMGNAVDACLFDKNTEKHHEVRVRAWLEDGMLCLEVSDNGVGMSEDVLKKIFTSFFSTKGHRGTGLGLMVTRKMVEEHGGRISVDSEPDRGTRFTIRLPCKQYTGGDASGLSGTNANPTGGDTPDP